MRKGIKKVMQPSNPEWIQKGYFGIVGFTTSNGILLDLDNTTLTETKRIAETYLKRFKLNGYQIMRSSQNNYHLIFDRYLNWKTVCSCLCKIIWCYHYHKHGIKPRLTNWVILQIAKGGCTLRISTKGKKPKPKLIYVHGKAYQLIKDYNTFYSEVDIKNDD